MPDKMVATLVSVFGNKMVEFFQSVALKKEFFQSVK